MKAKIEYTKEEKLIYFKGLLEKEQDRNAILSAKCILSDDRIRRLRKIIEDMSK